MKSKEHLVLKETSADGSIEAALVDPNFLDFDRSAPPAEIKNLIAKELNLDHKSVEAYFQYYYLNSRFPIRKLTTYETSFARTLRSLQYSDNHTLLGYLAQYQIRPEEHLQDRFLLARVMSGIPDDDEYKKLIKWQDYLLIPYIEYGNAEAPLLRPLSKMELFLIVSNIASGNSMIPGEKVEIKDQMNAVQKLIDAYSLLPPETEEIIPDEPGYEDLSVRELINAAKLLNEKDAREIITPIKKVKTESKKKTTTKNKKPIKKEKTK